MSENLNVENCQKTKRYDNYFFYINKKTRKLRIFESILHLGLGVSCRCSLRTHDTRTTNKQDQAYTQIAYRKIII